MMRDTEVPPPGAPPVGPAPHAAPATRTRIGSRWRKGAIRAAILVALLYFFGIPMVRLTWLSFSEPSGYGLGKAGWVNVPFGRSPSVGVICDWVEESYRTVAPKKLVNEKLVAA